MNVGKLTAIVDICFAQFNELNPILFIVISLHEIISCIYLCLKILFKSIYRKFAYKVNLTFIMQLIISIMRSFIMLSEMKILDYKSPTTRF